MTVYFVQDGGPDRHIKIGYTGTAAGPFGRIAQLQTGNPRPLKLLVCIPDGTAADEKALHERFKDLRATGEWFRPDLRLLGFIEGMRFAYPEQPKDPGPVETLYGLEREQAIAIYGYVRSGLVDERATSLMRELGWYREHLNDHNPSGELDSNSLLACVEIIDQLEWLLDREVSNHPFWAGACFDGRKKALEHDLAWLRAAVDRHHEAIGSRIAEERLARDGCESSVVPREGDADPYALDEEYP